MSDFDLLICNCTSEQHQIIIRNSNADDDFVYCTIFLNEYSFFKRLKHGIRYILGHKSKYGHFEEFLFDKSHIKSLEKVIEALKSKSY